jgi:hypothetical protein
MRKLLLAIAIFSIIITACKKNESVDEPVKNLVGMNFKAYNAKESITDSKVYNYIDFKTSDIAEIYSAFQNAATDPIEPIGRGKKFTVSYTIENPKALFPTIKIYGNVGSEGLPYIYCHNVDRENNVNFTLKYMPKLPDSQASVSIEGGGVENYFIQY